MCRNRLEAPVSDSSHLEGSYDFNLDFSHSLTIEEATNSGTQEAGRAPDFATALEQQLGLKLTKTKVSVDMVVIDRLQKEPMDVH
jgi:uncharacterized protein (TIGR03435 family)